MPNWCYNSLSVEGSKEDISAIKKQLNQPYTKQHDQWNPETNEMEVKDYTYSNPIFAFHNIYNHKQDGVSDEEYIKQPDHTLPIAEQMEFKTNDWYSWNVRNWGTKWDVGVGDDNEYPETELMEEDETSLAYRFNTAWSPPLPAIEALSAQYPDVEFNLSYEEETGWGGEHLFIDGNGTEIEVYNNKCRDCDALDSLEYCDNGCGEVCDECHYMGEADLDEVAECDEHKIYLDNVPDYRKANA
jgi:Ferredoxin-like domain in Api92-like protein